MKKMIMIATLMILSNVAYSADKYLKLEDAVVTQAKKWQQSGNAQPILSEDGKVLYPYGQYQPVMVCSPLRSCSIELEPGEKVNNLWPGDKTRWKFAEGTVGTGDKAIVQIGVKPTDIDIETNLKILTSKRAYQIKLVSKNTADYVDTIAFYYPEDFLEASLKKENMAAEKQEKESKLVNAEIPVSTLDKADFDYKIEGDPSIKPLRVFNNGVKTYIMMPPVIKTMEMPLLMLLDKQGQAQQVNYRLSPNGLTLEVDKLFEKAVLWLGPAGEEAKATISWNKAPTDGNLLPRWMRNLM